MKMKSFVFLFLLSVVFPAFSATQQPADSGSSQLGKPSVKFKSWEIGRSGISTDAGNKLHLTFITSTGTACYFTATAACWKP